MQESKSHQWTMTGPSLIDKHKALETHLKVTFWIQVMQVKVNMQMAPLVFTNGHRVYLFYCSQSSTFLVFVRFVRDVLVLLNF